MAFRATCVSQDPVNFFVQQSDEGPHFQVSDLILRATLVLGFSQIFTSLIRLGTNCPWSHSALLYLVSDPPQGFDDTFLVESTTPAGVRVASVQNEIQPYERFSIGIKRLPLDWYVEMPQDVLQHGANDPEDVHGIGYLRHVRGMAVDQINNMYDQGSVYELSAMFAERIAKEYLGPVPEVANAAQVIAKALTRWNETNATTSSLWQRFLVAIGRPSPANLAHPPIRDAALRFICSGLVQYSYFEALRRRIINNLKSDAAMQNLSNMQNVIFRDDPNGIIPNYIQQVQSGKISLSDDVSPEVINFLKTTTPADFSLCQRLQWRYIMHGGAVWQLEPAPDGYTPQNADESAVLKLLDPLFLPK